MIAGETFKGCLEYVPSQQRPTRLREMRERSPASPRNLLVPGAVPMLRAGPRRSGAVSALASWPFTAVALQESLLTRIARLSIRAAQQTSSC